MKWSLSPARITGALVLAAWGALFWFLLLTGRTNLYRSTRTSWVVPVGAVLLTLGALGRLAAARVGSPQPLRAREAWIMGLMVLPVVVLLALPPATLGQFSASKKTSFSSRPFLTQYGQFNSTGPITLLNVAAAQTNDVAGRALAKRAGTNVDFIGIVTRYDDTPADEFLLTRYVITCCVADATVAQVRVVNVVPGRFSADEWVEVRGPIYPIGREIIVDASSIQQVAQPDKPYVTP